MICAMFAVPGRTSPPALGPCCSLAPGFSSEESAVTISNRSLALFLVTILFSLRDSAIARYLLLLRNLDGCPRIFPVHVHVAAGSHLVERNREVFHRSGSLRHAHVKSPDLVGFILVGNTPLPGFLV